METVIPVGSTPLDVAWNPASNKVYTANSQGGSVTVIDGATNQVLATVPVADDPTFLCYNSVDNKVYCTTGDPDWLYVMDGVGDTVIKRVRMRGYPTLMTYNATMNKLYVLCYDDQMVRVYDGAADSLVSEVPLGSNPGTLLWHPVTNRVFCSLYGTDSVFTIDCTADQVTERLAVGRHPYPMCWNPMNGFVYVDSDGGIRVLTANGDSVVDVIAADALCMCFVPYPDKLYAIANRTEVIDCATQVVTDSLAYEGNAVVCDTIRGKVYSAATYPGQCYVFDAKTDTLLTAISLGTSPQAICWNRTNSRVYIADAMDGAVYVIRDTTTGVAEPVIAAVNLSSSMVASPNPFTRTVTIKCGVRLAPGAGIGIFSQDGRQVRRLVPGPTLPVSPATSAWDGRDELGRCVPRGVYLAVVEGQAGVRAKLVKLD